MIYYVVSPIDSYGNAAGVERSDEFSQISRTILTLSGQLDAYFLFGINNRQIFLNRVTSLFYSRVVKLEDN